FDTWLNENEDLHFILFETQSCTMKRANEIVNSNALIDTQFEPIQVHLGVLENQDVIINNGLNLKSLTISTGSNYVSQLFEYEKDNYFAVSSNDFEYYSNPFINNTATSAKLKNGEGFFLQSTIPKDLQFTGYPFKSDYELNLNAFENIIGYPYFESQPTEDGLQELINDEILVQIKNLNQVFNPEMPDYLNTLTRMNTGEGYIVNLSSPVSNFSIHPPEEKSAGWENFSLENNCIWDFQGYKNSAIKYIRLPINPNDYNFDMKAGAFIDGECRAIAPIVEYNNNYYASLVINSNDAGIFDIVLCSDGEEIEMAEKVYISPGSIDNQIEDLSRTNKISEDAGLKLFAYPNPANNVLNVYLNWYEPIANEKVEIKVCNIAGQVFFKSDFIGSEDKISINTNSYENGIYFLEVETDRIRKIQKIQILHK
ncbi:MAG: T9SS type A sorting domain-containing protein, partial [Prolixibacteraceae bacterium]|nr:T9SS type A sorting domain-containing protein [Prolixibacteraceae bacterium]